MAACPRAGAAVMAGPAASLPQAAIGRRKGLLASCVEQDGLVNMGTVARSFFFKRTLKLALRLTLGGKLGKENLLRCSFKVIFPNSKV